MYLWSPITSQISLKNSFGEVAFQIFTEIEMTQNENRSFGHQFEMVIFGGIFLLEYVFFSV